jgi:hypothetical protein
MLMDCVQDAGWWTLTKAEQERWLGACKAYLETMTKAGILTSSRGLKPGTPNPIVFGRGRMLFEGVENKWNLKLTNSRAFQNGNVLLCYEPAR